MNVPPNPVCPLGIELKVGQRWREVDPRYPNGRIITITQILHGGSSVRIMGKRQGKAAVRRFNGKRGGYEPVDAPATPSVR